MTPVGLGATRSRVWVHPPPLGFSQLCQGSLSSPAKPVCWHCSTRWVAPSPVQGVWHCHTILSASHSNPSLSCSCHNPFLTSDIDLDFPAVLAPGRRDPALPEPRVRLCQVLHLKLAGDLPWLDDGFDKLWAQRVPSAPWLSCLSLHTGLKLPSSLAERQVLLREPATQGW